MGHWVWQPCQTHHKAPVVGKESFPKGIITRFLLPEGCYADKDPLLLIADLCPHFSGKHECYQREELSTPFCQARPPPPHILKSQDSSSKPIPLHLSWGPSWSLEFLTPPYAPWSLAPRGQGSLLPSQHQQSAGPNMLNSQHQQSAGRNTLDWGKARTELPWTHHTRASAISLGWAYQNQALWCSQGPGHLQTSKKEERRSPNIFMAPQLGWGMTDVVAGARLWEASHMNQKQRLGHIFRRDFREHCSDRGRPC